MYLLVHGAIIERREAARGIIMCIAVSPADDGGGGGGGGGIGFLVKQKELPFKMSD
jgi:hypothetical protein